MANLTLSEKRKQRTQQQAATTAGSLSYTLGDLRAMRDVGIVHKEEQDPQQAAERRDYWLQKTAGTREEMRRQAEDVLLKDQQIFFPPSKTREKNRIGAGETGQAATVVPSDRIAPLGEREITDIPSKEETDALLEDALGFLEKHADDGKPKENPLTAGRPNLFVSQAEPKPVPQSKRVGAGEIATTDEQREAERQARMKELYDSTYSGAARDRIDAQNAQIDKEMEDWWAEVDRTGEEILKNNPDYIYKSLDLENIRQTDPMYKAKVAQGRRNENNKVEKTITQQESAISNIEGGEYGITNPNMGRDVLGAIFNAANASKASDAGYTQMTTGMRDMYAYLLTEYGPKVADRYLADLSDELRMREAQTRAENIVNPSYKGPMAGLVNNLLPYANAAESGFIAPMMGWTRFLNQIAGDPNHLPGDVRQYTSQIVGNMLGEEDGKIKIFGKNVKQTLHDLVETTASQWPQVIIGGLGGNQVETLLPMVIQVAGNEYDAAVEEGYGQNEARLYALLQAGTEYLTEIIGGVGFVSGGTLTEEMTDELVQKIRPGLLRLAASLGIDAAGEGVEEIISGMMDPFERRLALGDQEANLDWRDIAYQGALGGLSGLVMGGPANVSSYISDIGEKARAEVKNKAADTTVKGFDAANDKAAIMKEGMLAYGIDEELADQAADAAARMVNGEELTLEELQMLGADTDLSDFVVDVTQKHVEAAKTAEAEKTAQEQTETEEPEEQARSKPQLPTEQQYEEPEAEQLTPEAEQETAETEQTPEKPTLRTEQQYEEPESVVPDTTNMSDNRAAYEYGKAGLAVEDFEDLMGRQATAYEKGAMKRGQQQAAKERAKREAQIAHYRRSARPSNRTAGVSYMGSDEAASYNVEAANESAMSEKQKNAAKALELLSKATGMRFVLYESARNARGEHAGRNGWYDMKTQTAYIDVSSGINGEEAMIRTAAHEVTHHIKNWAPEKFKELQDFLINFYHTQGESSLNALIEEEIEEASAHGRQISREEALEETIANACENMLTDADAVGELAEKHTSLFARIKLHIDSFLAHLRKAIQGVGPSTNAGRMLWESANTMRQAQEIWFDALENASENLRGKINEALDEAVDEITKGSKSTDFILIPGTDFRLVDYRKPTVIRENVQRRARETGIAIRQNGQLVPMEQRTETEPAAQQEVMSAEEAKQALDIVENMAEPLQPVNTRISDMFEGAINQGAVNDLVTAATGTKAKKPISRFSSAAFKKLLEKWSDNEWVNAKTDAAKAAFESFAKKWYNAGRSGESQIQVPFEENDANYPIFLQDTFYRQGVTEKEAADRRAAIKTKKPTRKPKGATENGAEVQVPDQGTVQQAGVSGEADVRKLGDMDAETVPGVSGGRTAGTVQSPEGTRGRTVERAGGSDTAGDVSGRGVGDSEGGDLRPVSGLREEVTEENTEPLTVEEAAEESRQQKAEPVRNFVIGEDLDIPKGEKARFDANYEAIATVKRIIAEDRQATPEEQQILSRFIGWGGLANAFDESKWPTRYNKLKSILTDEEYEAARASTLNAHYTSVEVIRAMYEGLRNMGFRGGRMLEPSSGTGNFVGAMPVDMAGTVSSWRLVELDPLTSQIAKYLYPKTHVDNIGFENAKIPDNFVDVTIGNVPFGNFGVIDKSFPNYLTRSIHNYFFAKAIDKVRPGGILMFITSHYTMDSDDMKFREYMKTKANFLGAVRLPYTAFKNNADTEVVTDIIVMQRRADNETYGGLDFTRTGYVYPSGGDYLRVNDYFVKHPEMVLGEIKATGSMYGDKQLNVEPTGDNLGEQIVKALGNITAKMTYDRVITNDPVESTKEAIQASKKTKENGFERREDGLYQNINGELVKADLDQDSVKRISDMLEMRDTARDLLQAQQTGKPEADVKSLRKLLNNRYDRFVEKYGAINSQKNRSAIKLDPDAPFIEALENYDPEKKTATKSDIFTKNTVERVKRVDHADSAADALNIVLNESNHVDIDRIAELTGDTSTAAEKNLLDNRIVFKDEDGRLIPRDEYLSGNVRNKLRIARELAEEDNAFNANVEELEKVMPKDIDNKDIRVKMGATWIPDTVYTQFLQDMMGSSYKSRGNDIRYDKISAAYVINAKKADYYFTTDEMRDFAYKGYSLLDLIDANMNNRMITVREKIDDRHYRMNPEDTFAVRELQNKLEEKFESWLWEDEERRETLTKLYNEIFNSNVLRDYDGSYLTVDGLSAGKSLRPHQAKAVQRAIQQGGNLLLAHKVGAGKTAEMAAIAMKLRQLGIIKKPLFTVPKNLVSQWGKEFLDFFPGAKILVASDDSFTAANRKLFMNKIATGDYDAVIVSYEQYEKIPMSIEAQRKFYQEQIDSAVMATESLRQQKGEKSRSVKQIEKAKKQLEAKLAKLDNIKRDEDNIDFEQTGIDGVFVDEAHNFKNLYYTSAMQISGLGNKDGSQRAFDMYQKVRYLQSLNGGKGIVFATATPVMNSMSEMYTMQRYLQPDTLEQLNIFNFDAWANEFGTVIDVSEPTPAGDSIRIAQSFSRFKNMPELQTLFRSFADVMTEIPGLKVPKLRGGKRIVVESDPTDFQLEYIAKLAERSDNIKNNRPGTTLNGSPDNMLAITSEGRKLALTQKMIDPSLGYGEGSKVFKCVDNVYQEYVNSNKIKGTQIIFCDLSTPKSTTSDETNTEATDDAADVYNEIKRQLVLKGIKPNEIAFIHEANNQVKKDALFKKVREGSVRVLLGSSAKMGVGMNVQDRVVALHHLDCPYRPGDIEQREGRAIRQKNMNEEVAVYTYVTKKTFDARMWSKIETKQNFISQVMNGDNTSREIEGDEMALSAAEVKAIATGNPLVMEQVTLQNDIRKLEAQERTYKERKRNAQNTISSTRVQLASFEERLPKVESDAKRVQDISGERFEATVGKKKINNREEFGKEVIRQASKHQSLEAANTSLIGSIAGLDLFVTNDGMQGVRGEIDWTAKINPESGSGTCTMLENKIKSIKDMPKNLETAIDEAKTKIDQCEKILTETFDKAEELNKLRVRNDEISEILNPKMRNETGGVSDDSTEKYSERRTDVRSDRELLANAFEGLAADDTERAELAKYKAQIGALEEKTDLLKDINSQIKDISFGKGKRDMNKLQQLKTRKEALLRTITDADKILLRMEKSEALRRVLEVEKQKEKTRIQKKADERVGRIRETAVRNAYKQSIEKRLGEMTEYLTRPTTKKYVPETLRAPLLEFVKSVDFSSQRKLKGKNPTKKDIRFAETLKSVNDALERVNSMYSTDSAEGMVESNFGMYLDLPDGFKEELTKLTASVMQVAASSQDGYTVNNMTSDQLKTFSKLISALSKGVTNMNKMMASTLFQHLEQATTDTINTLKSMRMKNASTKIGKSLEWDNAMPAYAFERFGKGGEAIFQGFKNGQAALAFNTEEILRFTKDCFTEKEAQAWGKEIKTLELENGETLNIPVSHIMSLHCLMKRAQAQGHIFGGGIRVSNYKAGSKLMQDTGHNVTEQDVKNLESMLTERQIWVADQMQNYMAEKGSEWGNYVSLRRFGYRFFEEGPTYFPISSDGDFLPTFNEEGGKGSGEGRNLYALLNISPAKDIVKGANNRIAIYDIFDVFSNHMSDMAQYNAFALPVLDAIKWFNYKEKFNNHGDKSFKPTSIKQSMREAFGDAAVGYVKNLIADVSGAQATGGNENTSGLTMLHRYNRAQVAANLRVAMLQPLSYVRAGMELNIGSMAKALALNPIRLRSNIAEMQELSGIARWKELGFYDNNVSRSVRQLIKGEERTIDKITTKTMTLAEKMDQVTWAAMWEASKQQVARRIGRNSENFYDEVVKLFENTIYKTQVVDSILTKSSFMRNGSTWNKVMSSFMSESVTTYNMIADCIWKLADMSRSDNVTAESKQRLAKKIGRAGIVYAANVIVTTILEALMNAYRDDDDYKTFWEKFKDGIYVDLIDNAAPWNWLPLWSQLWDVVKGGINVITGDDNWYSYGTDNPFTQGAQMLVDYTSKIKQKIEAIEKDGADAWMSGYTKWGLAYKGMQAVSAISGLPFATGAREAVSIWNATAANADHQLKLQTYNTPVSVGTNALIQAAAGNDSARALQLVQEMQENGYDLESIQKKTVSAAAVAVYNNELDIDTAVRILKEYGGKTKTEAESYLHDYLTKKETDYNSKYGHVYEYISDWNGSELKREIKLLQDQGNENKNIMSGITNQFKKEYIAASKSERATMKQHLIVAYKLLGLSEDAAAKKIDDWLK